MTQKLNKRKRRKHNQDSPNVHGEMPYEKVPRYSNVNAPKNSLTKENVKRRQLLPIKAASGKVISQEVEEEMEEKLNDAEPQKAAETNIKKTYIPESKEQMLINRRKVICFI